MNVREELIKSISIPKMVKVRQRFPRPKLEDIPAEVRKQVCRQEITSKIKKGDRVAITAGSRGVANIALILREIVSIVKEMGAFPFLVPAMGSHGGATASGQVKVLNSLGITEEYAGAPIMATMEVTQLGTTESGLPVCYDRYAAEADATIIVGRIKPHTSFRGKYESGLAKMIVIGLGKQIGAELCHSTFIGNMSTRIEEAARNAISKSNIIFGVGIIENAYDETCKIAAIDRDCIMEEEPQLLLEAKENMPQIMFEDLDVLVIDEIGKNICGTGMDPTITGRFGNSSVVSTPKAQKIAILDLTEETDGNANGTGLADVCTKRLFEKIDFDKTYANPLTSRVTDSVRVPMIMENDAQAIKAAIKTCVNVDYNNIRMVRIKNTLKLGEIYISENLIPAALSNPGIEIIGEPEPMDFDSHGCIKNF